MRWGEEKLPGETTERVVPIDYYPHQLEFIRTPERIVGLVGGVGSGKTRGLGGYVVDKLYRERGRGTVGGVLANTYKQLAQSTLPELWDLFRLLGFEYGRDYVYNEAPPRFWVGFRSRFVKDYNSVLSVRWWGQVVVRSLDDPDSVRGLTLGWAALDEARDTTQDAFNIVLARLRCPRCSAHELRLASTPNGFDWMYELLATGKTPNSKMITAATSANLSLPSNFESDLLAVMDPLVADQEVRGKFVSLMRGAVYRMFDRNVHVNDRFGYFPDRDVYVSFDFNRTPFCVVLAHVEPGVRMHVFDEIYMLDSDTGSVCKEILEQRLYKTVVNRSANPRVIVHGDPSGSHADTRNNLSDWDIVTQWFDRVLPGRWDPAWRYHAPPVLRRVNVVNGLLMNSHGQSRFGVHPRCEKLIRDFERVRFKPGSKEIDKTSSAEVRMLTHLTDALGYLVDEEFPLNGSAGGSGRVRT